MALTLFKSGSTIKPTDFYDTKQEVSIAVVFDGITHEILDTLTPEHAERIADITVDGRLTLVRRYGLDGKPMLSKGAQVSDAELEDFGNLFEGDEKLRWREIIASDSRVSADKSELLRLLRNEGIIVLSRGAIETYYLGGVCGDDKPTRAIAACRAVQSREQALSTCDQLVDNNGIMRPELELVFETIFA